MPQFSWQVNTFIFVTKWQLILYFDRVLLNVVKKSPSWHYRYKDTLYRCKAHFRHQQIYFYVPPTCFVFQNFLKKRLHSGGIPLCHVTKGGYYHVTIFSDTGGGPVLTLAHFSPSSPIFYTYYVFVEVSSLCIQSYWILLFVTQQAHLIKAQ